MKVTIYTINDCTFSQKEKEYLNANNIVFEEKNLETNRDYLTEMLKVSDNFAGTPVTKIEKDGGEIMVLKGFTPDEFAKALGLTSSAEVVPPAEEAQQETTPQASSTPTPPTEQPPAPMTPLPPESTAPKATDELDMTIESLSEPTVSIESPASPVPPMPQQPPAQTTVQPDMNVVAQEPETPVNPLENQDVGPISLDANTTTPVPAEAPVTPMRAPTPSVSGAQPTEEKPKNKEGLDSVLQNLQSQVQGDVSPTSTPPKE